MSVRRCNHTHRAELIEQDLPLLAWLTPLVTDPDLHFIAEADYGHEGAAHLQALLKLRAGDLSPLAPLDRSPGEVLALARWQIVDPRSPHRIDAHRRRLFACALLLVAAADARNRSNLNAGAIEPTVIAAVDSAREAFPNRVADLGSLLEWYENRKPWDPALEEKPATAVARLLCCVHAEAPAEVLKSLCAVIDERINSLTPDPFEDRRPYARLLDPHAVRTSHQLWMHHLDAAADALARRPDAIEIARWLGFSRAPQT